MSPVILKIFLTSKLRWPLPRYWKSWRWNITWNNKVDNGSACGDHYKSIKSKHWSKWFINKTILRSNKTRSMLFNYLCKQELLCIHLKCSINQCLHFSFLYYQNYIWSNTISDLCHMSLSVNIISYSLAVFVTYIYILQNLHIFMLILQFII